ncbi:MAG TPA: GNAT family N-acetyltransferase [Acidobacteriaceae bacterium]|jgi:predicted GNAT family N-acyltransferase|nr:GNAT family N-acetyltransferase [Acidobacteriaceae bacterium]
MSPADPSPILGPDAFHVEILADAHDRANFCCGVEALDAYFRRQAKQDVDRRVAAVFVLTADGEEVAGFYTLSSLSISGTDLPEPLAKKLPSRAPIGVTLLGRMAVSEKFKGKKLGVLLLMHSLKRAFDASRQVASWAVVVDAKEGSREFYLKYEFTPLPSNQHRLFLPMKMIERLFNSEAR